MEGWILLTLVSVTTIQITGYHAHMRVWVEVMELVQRDNSNEEAQTSLCPWLFALVGCPILLSLFFGFD